MRPVAGPHAAGFGHDQAVIPSQALVETTSVLRASGMREDAEKAERSVVLFAKQLNNSFWRECCKELLAGRGLYAVRASTIRLIQRIFAVAGHEYEWDVVSSQSIGRIRLETVKIQIQDRAVDRFSLFSNKCGGLVDRAEWTEHLSPFVRQHIDDDLADQKKSSSITRIVQPARGPTFGTLGLLSL